MKQKLQILGADGRPVNREKAERITLRRWEAAETNRLNSGHWSTVKSTSINQDLRDWLDVLRTRSIHEAANNPIVEGMIVTHITDMIGTSHPLLQVRGGSQRYRNRLEEVWWDFWQSPDLNGQLSGSDLISQWVRMLWLCGEFFTQIAVDQQADTPIKTRLVNIHPRRIGTPAEDLNNAQTALGIDLTNLGKPVNYHVADVPANDLIVNAFMTFKNVPAADMIHGFRIDEPGQIRGTPWLACALQVIADLRDYEAQVLDAARAAADSGVMLTTTDPRVEPIVVDASVEIERRMMQTMPPGWNATQLTPTQPAANYIEYRKDKLSEIARMICMPLMMVRLDSREHSFSSARFDSQLYWRYIAMQQAWMERRALNRLVDRVAREAQLVGLLPAKGASVYYEWTWPPRPQVNPVQEEDAEASRLSQTCTGTYQEACARDGRDWQKQLEQRVVERDAFKAMGMPYPGEIAKAPKPAPNQQQQPDPQAQDAPAGKVVKDDE